MSIPNKSVSVLANRRHIAEQVHVDSFTVAVDLVGSHDSRNAFHGKIVLPLNHHRHCVAAAEAEGGDAALSASANELVDERDEDAGAAGADGVAEGDAAACDVELRFRNADGLDVLEDLRGEGFVEFEEVDVVDAEARLLQ